MGKRVGNTLKLPIDISVKTIEKGMEYCSRGMVEVIRQYMGAYPDSTCHEASVKGSGGKRYDVYLQTDSKGELLDSSCDCLAFETYPGQCKHIAAVIFAINKLEVDWGLGLREERKGAAATDEKSPDRGQKEPATALTKRTDFMAEHCIEQYEMRGLLQTERSREGRNGTIRATPRLVWSGNTCGIEITVGEKRQYSVRSLQEFCRAISQGAVLTFGKQLSFEGSYEAFDEKSRKIIEMIVGRYEDMMALERVNFSSGLLVDQLFVRGRRAMYLTPKQVDELMAMYMNQRIAVKYEDHSVSSYRTFFRETEELRSYAEQSYERELSIKDHRPVVQINVTGDKGGLHFSTASVLLLSGEKYLYLNSEEEPGFLWRCGRQFAVKMEHILKAMGSGSIFVAKKDLPRFCGSVLPNVKEFVTFTGDVGELDKYIPDEPEMRVYLDSPAPDAITAVIKGDYDDLLINLYNGKIEYENPEDSGDMDRDSVIREKGSRVIRNEAQERDFCTFVERYFEDVDFKRGELSIRGSNVRLYEFLMEGQQELVDKARVFVTDRYRRLSLPVKNKMAVGVSLESDLLEVSFGFEGLPPDELQDVLKSYQRRKRFHRLKNGNFLSLEEPDLKEAFRLAEEFDLTGKELAGGRVTMPRYRAMYLDSVMKQTEGIRVDRDAAFKSLMREMNSVEDSDLKVPASLENIMRDYQKMGFCWLNTMSKLGFGGILADDMGLGKTLEVISLLVSESEDRAAEKGILALVVCPASLVLNWEKELSHFAPELLAYPVLGSARVRKGQIQELRDQSKGETEAGMRRCVVITSYDLLKRDLPLYEGLLFQYHIIDEAQYIKNYSTQNAKAVKGVESLHRFALTGTPVENRLSELWSIFDFLMPGYLRSYGKFKDEYELPILKDRDQRKTELLKRQITPFVLRRLKEKVLLELPEKLESVVYVPMEDEQQRMYVANLAEAKEEMSREMREGRLESNKLQVLALLTRLRQICCHPSLCYEGYTKGSGKLEACIELIREAAGGGHRVLLFSQFTSMLSLIAGRVKKEGLDYYMLTGQTDKVQRQKLVSQFNENDVPIFLISLKAGGTGLNLTGADVVIHYDPWWNRAAQNQATDRAHRMGQQRRVQVYKLVSEGTIEEKIIKLQEAKGELADAIISENSAVFSSMDANQMWDLFE